MNPSGQRIFYIACALFILAVIASIMLTDQNRDSTRSRFDPTNANHLVEAVKAYYENNSNATTSPTNDSLTLSNLVENGFLKADRIAWTTNYVVAIQPPPPKPTRGVVITLTPTNRSEPVILLYSDRSVGLADD